MATIFNDGDKVTKEFLNKVSVTNTDACCDATTPEQLRKCIGAAADGDAVEEAPSNDKIYGRKNTQWVDIDPTGTAFSHASTTGRDAVNSHPQAAITGLTTHVTTVTNHIGDDGIHFKLYSGTTDPDPALGEDGDLYIKEESNARAAMTSVSLHAAGLGTEGERAATVGCNAEGDGGGGTWYWDSSVLESTANLGTTINPRVGFSLALQGSIASPDDEQSGCWVRSDVASVDPLWFGAITDGAKAEGVISGTDNSAAFQAAIDYATIDGYPVYIPAGVYRLDSTLTLPAQHGGITVEGAGTVIAFEMYQSIPAYYGTVLLFTDTTTDVFSLVGGGGYAGRGVRISNMSIDSIASSGWAISLTGAPDRTIVDNIVMHSQKGVQFNDMWTNCEIRNCQVDANDSSIPDSIGFVLWQETLLGGLNSIVNSTAKSVETGVSVGYYGGSGSQIQSVSLIKSQAIGCVTGFEIGGCKACVLDGCHFEGNTAHAINATSVVSGLSITGSYFLISSTSAVGILLRHTYSFDINTCVFLSTQAGATDHIQITDLTALAINTKGSIRACLFSDSVSGSMAIKATGGSARNIEVEHNEYDMVGGTGVVTDYLETDAGETFGRIYTEADGITVQETGNEILMSQQGSQRISWVERASANNLRLAEGSAYVLITGSTTIWGVWQDRLGGRDMLEGEIIHLMADTAGLLISNNSGSATALKTHNKSGATITIDHIGEIHSYVLKDFSGTLGWYEM